MEENEKNCDRCGEDLRYAGSHYHCSNCTSVKVTSMLGHFLGVNNHTGQSYFCCDPKDVIPGGER